jgi:hypothetical protein
MSKQLTGIGDEVKDTQRRTRIKNTKKPTPTNAGQRAEKRKE